MIILINGPFGVGKTTTATILKENIKNSLIFDPEEIGGMLRAIITEEIQYPEEKTEDFQDLILWKRLTVLTATELINTYNVNLIIPMTISNIDYFRYILSELKKTDGNIFHFCLLAKKDEIVNRLLKRGEIPGSWPFKQTDKCLCSFENNPEIFGQIIRTDSLSEFEVAHHILRMLKVSSCDG